MDADLAALSDAAKRKPLDSRKSLYQALREARLTVLVDDDGVNPASAASEAMGAAGAEGTAPEELPVWAERDAVLGGLWVPVFTSEARCEGFARGSDKPLREASGPAGELFDALLRVPCFAGVRLDPGRGGSVRLERAEVRALSGGLVPGEAPALYELESPLVALPDGIPCRFGEADPAFGPPGRRAVFPAAPGLSMQDFRSMVRLELPGGPAWAPCRNFAAALASAPAAPGGRAALDETLVEALTAFGMYGEAESLCARARADAGRRSWALGHLGRVLRRAGRLDECVAHCRAALEEAPDESRLYRSLALACAELEDLDGAREAARLGLARLPEDPTLRRFL